MAKVKRPEGFVFAMWELEQYEEEMKSRYSAHRALNPHDLTFPEAIKIDEALHNAARNGELERVKKLVENMGFRVNETDDIGESAICKAARGGSGKPLESADYLGVIEYLFAKGATGSPGALYLAVAHNQLSIVQFLVSKGIKPVKNARTVFFAAEKSDEMLDLVLTIEGIKINYRDRHGSALDSAVSLKRFETAERLLARQLNQFDAEAKMKLIETAARNKDPKMVKLISKY